MTLWHLPIPALVDVAGMRLSSGEVVWAIERMEAKSEKSGDCWEWTGYRKNGYGSLSIRNHAVYMHQLSCSTAHGAIPDGWEACHSCDFRPCWNPAHLSARTKADNIADMRAKGRAVNPPRVTGLRQHLARLTDEEVSEIRRIWDAGAARQREIAAAYGCSQSTVGRIVNGQVRV